MFCVVEFGCRLSMHRCTVTQRRVDRDGNATLTVRITDHWNELVQVPANRVFATEWRAGRYKALVNAARRRA